MSRTSHMLVRPINRLATTASASALSGRRRSRTALLGLVGVAALTLAGCSSSGTMSSPAIDSGGMGAPMSEGVDPTAQDSSGASANPPTRDGKSSTDYTSATGIAPLTADRSIVVRADVSVRVDDVPASTANLATIASRHRATIASQSTSSGSTFPTDYQATKESSQPCPGMGCPTPYASSTTILRVDNSEVDALLRDVNSLGNVEASNRTSDDVTAEVADVNARLANAEASLARVRSLMSQATSIGDIVNLEAELSRREGDLEALQARQRALVDQTAQATVTVRLFDEGAPVVEPDDGNGFIAGLRSGWNAFTSAMVAGLTVVGVLVPFLIIAVPVVLVIWWIRRRRRNDNAVSQAAGPNPDGDAASLALGLEDLISGA